MALASRAGVGDRRDLHAHLKLAVAFDGGLLLITREGGTAEGTFGPIAGLIANAATGGKFASLGDYAADIFDSVLRTNLTCVFWVIKHVLPGMIDRKRGSIVVTGRPASNRTKPDNAAYVVSKHGVLGLARAAAVEAAPHNGRVNCLDPGLIETRM